MKENLKYFTDIVNTKYAEFTGRAGRREYWMYCLWLTIFYVAICLVAFLIKDTKYIYILSVVPTMLTVLTIVPTMALCVRRLHDIGRDWYWIFIAAIPVVGVVWYLILVTKRSDEGENRFGECPA